MKWLREIGYPWDYWTFPQAAEHGNLINRIWFQDNECPWDYQTLQQLSKMEI